MESKDIIIESKMNFKTEISYNVQIWVGLKDGYSNTIQDIEKVRGIVDTHVIDGDCVSITSTEFRYTNGFEPGVVIGYIQYPRFFRDQETIKQRALKLAKLLLYGLNQYRITITTPKESIMLINDTK